jgi:hypothetical protein
MADKRNTDRTGAGDQAATPETDERLRGVADDDAEFDDSEDLDEDDEEDDEEGGGI